MRIVNDGCELYYLLIVTGSERGNVWYDGRMNSKGIFPLEGKNGRVAFDEFVTPWHAKLLRLGPR